MSKPAHRNPGSKSSARTRTAESPPPLVNRPALFALKAGVIVLLAAVLAARIWPDGRWWGVHMLNYLPLALSIPLVLLALVLLTPYGESFIALASAGLRRLPRIPAGFYGLAALALFYLHPVTAPLLGDGQLWLNELSTIARYQEQHNTPAPFPETMERNLRKEPLEIRLHDLVFQWVRPYYPQSETGPAPKDAFHALERQTREENKHRDAGQQTYRLLSALAGALMVMLTIFFARRSLPAPGRGLFYIILFGSAAMLLFFGYVENYAWASLAVLACLYAVIDELRVGLRVPWKSWLLLALAVGFHYAAIMLLPAVLLATLFALRRATQPREVRRLFTLTALLYLLAGAAAYIYVEGWRGWFTIMPLAGRADGYTLFASAHLFDLLNLLALLAPSALILVIMKRGLIDEPIPAFLVMAASVGLLFVATFNPNLGMAVDWDLLAMGLLPLVVAGACFAAASIAPQQHAPLAATLVALVLLVGLPYIILNTTEPLLLRRYEDLLRLDTSRSAYGWEKLGTHYERRGDIIRMYHAYLEALVREPNPRYNFKVADALLRQGKDELAASYAEAAARKNPVYAGLVAYVGVVEGKAGHWRRGRELLQIAAECNPADTLWASLLRSLDTAVADSSVKPPAH
jgi:hypothetical protein